jgi:hypothetical protein
MKKNSVSIGNKFGLHEKKFGLHPMKLKWCAGTKLAGWASTKAAWVVIRHAALAFQLPLHLLIQAMGTIAPLEDVTIFDIMLTTGASWMKAGSIFVSEGANKGCVPVAWGTGLHEAGAPVGATF